MITIKLDLFGTLTHASCTCLEDEKPRSFSAIENSGAKALTSLVDALRKAGKAGAEWEVIGHPELKGQIPGKSFRKPVRRPRHVQTKWAV